MGNENGEWIIHGISEDDPRCIKSSDALIEYVNSVGFLPLFKNEIEGFSVEELTVADYWWTENSERDPWQWREVIAGSGKTAYGRFFGKKAGFISLDWLPYFVNYRRSGYDFDARWEDEKASRRHKLIMDLFAGGKELFSFEAKQLAGFGKGGEKNFEGTITELQMQTYLVMKDFRQRLNKAGLPYGWKIAVYAAPESIWSYDFVTSAYKEAPERSFDRIIEQAQKIYPNASEKQLIKALK